MILRSELLIVSSAFVLPAWSAAGGTGDSGRPRGVGPEFAKFYKSASDTFTCISSPSQTIPFSSVNDDYCDCPDGSDEPGTAACSYLSPLSPPQLHPGTQDPSVSPNTSLALPGFYCKNKGHMPMYLRFEGVNDGRCDYDICCDGSDEYDGVGGIKCPDKCAEIGKEWKKNEEIRQKAMLGALKRKKELLAQATRLMLEAETKVKDLEIRLEGNEVRVKEAQGNLKSVEAAEKLRVVQGQAAGKGTGKLGVLLGLAKSRVEELRTTLRTTKHQRDNMMFRVQELEDILGALQKDHNPNFNDEGVKRAVRLWEDYAARVTDDQWTDAQDRDLESVLAEDNETTGIDWSSFESSPEPEDDVTALYQLTSYLPPSFTNWISRELSSLRQILVSNGMLADPSTSPTDLSDSKAVQSAKKGVTDAERDRTNAQNDLNRANEDLTKDYGTNSIFRAVKDTCIQKDSGEYTYEMCFMGSTKQIPKKGGGHTTLGNFVGFDSEVVDDAGGVLGEGERVVMKFENGQHCWNGPNRSTRVVLVCAEKDEVYKVSESEKCVYRMEIGTSAVCESNGNGGGGKKEGEKGGKDEL